MDILVIYLLLINAAGLLLMLIDKQRAKKNQWRIRESTLMSVAAFGGSVGVFIGMHLFRHKTKHPKFRIGIPVILGLHTLIVVLIFDLQIILV